MKTIKMNQLFRGVASLELIVVLAVILAGLSIAIPLVLNSTKIDRDLITRKKMLLIKQAIVGEPSKTSHESRTNFGFLGDTGVLPSNPNAPLNGDGFEDLFTNTPATGSVVYPVWQESPGQAIWFGWRGPYLDNFMANGSYIALLDAWGNTMIYYDTDGDTDTWDATIRSAGPNGVFDYTPEVDDLIENIIEKDVRSFISGWFKDTNKDPIEESQVTVYYPSGVAGLTSVNITTNSVDKTVYDTDPLAPNITAVIPSNMRKIPLGAHYFETLDNELKKLGTLNSGGTSTVNFVAIANSSSDVVIDFEEGGLSDFVFKGSDADDWDIKQRGGVLGNKAMVLFDVNTLVGESVAVLDGYTWENFQLEAEFYIQYQNKYEEGFGIDYRVIYDGNDPLPKAGYRFCFFPESTPPYCKVDRYTNKVGSELHSWDSTISIQSKDFFKIYITVKTNPDNTISHTIKIDQLIDNQYVEKENESWIEDIDVNSSLSGKIGFLLWGTKDRVALLYTEIKKIL